MAIDQLERGRIFIPRRGENLGRLSDVNARTACDLAYVNREYLRERYGIMAVLRRPEFDPKPLTFKIISQVDAASALIVVREELAKYEPEYVKFCRVGPLYIVGDLRKGIEVEGKTLQVSLGGEAHNGGLTYLDFDPDKIEQCRASTHHELQHHADSREDEINAKLGEEGEKLSDAPKDAWEGINEQTGLPYLGDHYWLLKDEEIAKKDHTGFACVYGMVDWWEDRATVAEKLGMNKPLLSGDDMLVREKARRIIEDIERRTKLYQPPEQRRRFFPSANLVLNQLPPDIYRMLKTLGSS